MKTKFAIGTYNFDGTPKTKKTKRHNRTYKGKLTKRNQTQLNKELLILFTFCIPFILVQALGATNNICDFMDVQEAPVILADDGLEAEDVANNQANTFSAEGLDYMRELNPVESEILAIADEHNFKWKNYLVRLAFLESSLNPNATNTNNGGSVDRGVFQWNDKYHPEISDECAFNVRCATIATINAINEGHQDWWVMNERAKNKSLTIK